MSTYKIYIFDDCCHLFASIDTGDTWVEHGTPDGRDPNDLTSIIGGTMGDDWTDMAMAVNDGDYGTLALIDNAVTFGQYDGVYFDGANVGVEIVTDYTQSSTSHIYAPSKIGVVNQDFQEAFSAAISAGGRTVLVPVYTYDLTASVADSYPRLTTNFGTTWADVTGLPANKQWTRACFSQSAEVMYIHQLYVAATPVTDHGGIWKSGNSGATWSLLSNAPTFEPTSGQVAPGSAQNSLRLRCSQDGSVVAAIDWFGNFWVSTDAGAHWTHINFPTDKLSSDSAHTTMGDFGMSLDGSTLLVGISNSHTVGTGSYVWTSTDSGANWTQRTLPSNAKAMFNANVAPDGLGMVVAYSNGTTIGLVDVSTDGGVTWTAKTFTMTVNPDNSQGTTGPPGTHVSSFIVPASDVVVTPTGDPGGGALIGATYRRVSAFATETPAFVGWHRHDLGHARTLTSIGVSGDTGGLLDNLDMVTTDGTNTYVEGFTQIFDEDDDLTDGWFLDGALVPDSAYEDTLVGVTGIRFTGLWYLRSQFVTVCAFGLDLGDFTVDTDGTLFVPYGSGTAPSLFDYTSAGAGAYLFTAAYITANVQTAAPRNGGVFISSGYMPVVVGYTFVSDGQTLRPAAQEQVGTRTGSPFGQKRRSHYVKALLRNTIGLQFGTDFGTTLQAAELADDAGTQPTPTQPYSGLWRETLNDDYTFDSMLSWRIVRPYPASVVSIGASVEGQDA